MISETCPTLAEVMLKWELTHQDQERTIMSAEHNGATYTITHFPENAFKGKPVFTSMWLPVSIPGRSVARRR